MSVFGNRNYAQQPVARTPNYVKAAGNSAYVQQMNAENKRKDKQENLEGMGMMANSLREGGMLEGAIPAFKAGYAGAPTAAGVGSTVAPAASQAGLGSLAMNAAPVANTVGPGAFTLGGAEAASAAALAGSAPAATTAAAGSTAAAGGLGAGATAALASNPVGWAALAALAAYSLFG
jgi:hypothetical protein